MARLIFWPCLASYCVQRNRGEDAVRKGEKGKELEKDNKLTYQLKVMKPIRGPSSGKTNLFLVIFLCREIRSETLEI